jgi:putative molybdopterin biosynthesis protein
MKVRMKNDKIAFRRAVEQQQFLQVLTRDQAVSAFRDALNPGPIATEWVALAGLAGRVLASDVMAPVDTPPFDRSVVDGFAVRSTDLSAASGGAPVRLRLNDEVIACGALPQIFVEADTATPIATGGPIPRGADAVAMVEHTEPEDDGILVKRAVTAGQNIAFAGSDIARGQTLLHMNTVMSAREIGILAAVGLATAEVWGKPNVAVISTGDELIQPGEPLRPAMIYDSNGAIVAAALEENGCTAIRLGTIPDDEEKLTQGIRFAHQNYDAVILSGGTSKGSGDLTHRIIGRLGSPGIVVHGVALKPGKPLCLAVCDGKPVVVLPGFPTSAMFTFHDIVAPILRRLAGLPERPETQVKARFPIRVTSELGRTEFVMVALTKKDDGLVAHPIGKGSGAVTAFSMADGFVSIDALSTSLAADTEIIVNLLTPQIRIPDLVVMGSHCIGLDCVIAVLSKKGMSARTLAIGSLGGLAALKRGECDVAPIHLYDPETRRYNAPFLTSDVALIPGWRRLQGIVFRRGDQRFEDDDPSAAIVKALADPGCLMVNRNQGSGTRVLIDNLLNGATPAGYWNQPRSHNAVAASVAQGRADWGIAIKPVADELDLGFIPLAQEHYDFAVLKRPRDAGALEKFREALAVCGDKLRQIGFVPINRSRASEDAPHEQAETIPPLRPKS